MCYFHITSKAFLPFVSCNLKSEVIRIYLHLVEWHTTSKVFLLLAIELEVNRIYLHLAMVNKINFFTKFVVEIIGDQSIFTFGHGR
jgi:hypothetical protein